MRISCAVAVLLSVGAAPGLAHAQPVFAPLIAVHTDGHYTFGGVLAIPLGEPEGGLLLGFGGAAAAPELERIEEWTYWEANADLIFRTTNPQRARLFALTGVNLARAQAPCSTPTCPARPPWDTSVGVNLGVGVAFVWDWGAPMMGVKVELKGGGPFVFFLGAAVPFPGVE